MSASNPKNAPVVVLRKNQSDRRRYLLRLLPASLVSVFAHVALLFLFFLLTAALPVDAQVDDGRNEQTMSVELPPDQRAIPFSSDDLDLLGLEPDLMLNYADSRIGKFSIPGEKLPDEQAGIPGAPDTNPPVNVQPPGGWGEKGLGAAIASPMGGNSNPFSTIRGGYNERGQPLSPGSPNGRSGETREYAWRNGGGSPASERAVTIGMKWLARQQFADGRWMLNSPNLPAQDRGAETNDIAATALGLLPFLGAGKTHRPENDNPYDKVIDKGLKYLIRNQDPKTGYFGVSMYAHGLATIAMCEAYGLSQDPTLRRPAQNAINLIVNAQHETGGWRYTPAKAPGDMSISGWQIMALKSGQMANLDVPSITVSRAKSFLNSCVAPNESYGYLAGTPGTPRMTAVALLCRQYMENWGPSHPRMIKSIVTQIKTNPPDRRDVYFYYYATQVMHHFGGEEWRDWNTVMRESLIKKQDLNEQSANVGSWSAAGDPYGRSGGRLMMTSLNLLTLEVYYRYLPLYYRDAGYKMDAATKKAL